MLVPQHSVKCKYERSPRERASERSSCSGQAKARPTVSLQKQIGLATVRLCASLPNPDFTVGVGSPTCSSSSTLNMRRARIGEVCAPDESAEKELST